MIDNKRRMLLKGSLAAGSVGAALGAGLLTPQSVMAAWNAAAFGAKDEKSALKNMYGSDATENSASINIKAPDIAENGAVVPVTVESKLDGVTSIAIVANSNATPLIATFNLPDGTLPFVSTRIKMGKTGDVVAVLKVGDKMLTARKSVKVTIGGCGG
jgi:sulfur-oxidizing protein SoxY